MSLFAPGLAIDSQRSEALQAAVADVLLRNIVDLACRAAAELPDGTSLVAAAGLLHALDLEPRRRLVLQPACRYWLQAMRRCLDGRDPTRLAEFARALPGLVWAEAAIAGRLRGGLAVETDAMGGLRCPARGLFIELGTGYARQTVWLEASAEGVAARLTDGLTVVIALSDLTGMPEEPWPTIAEHGYALNPARRTADGAVVISSRDPWLRVRLTGTNQRTTGTNFFDTDDDAYDEWGSSVFVDKAFALLGAHWPEGYADVPRFTHVIVPMRAAADHGYRAFTVSSRQGAVFLGQAPVYDTVEMILHENAHVKLRQMQYLDPLLTDPFDESVRVPVPWRPDPRPIPGIFEGLYVFAHVAEFEARRLAAGDQALAPEKLVRRLEGLDYAAGCLQARARFTEQGEAFFAGMLGWIGDLQTRGAGLA